MPWLTNNCFEELKEAVASSGLSNAEIGRLVQLSPTLVGRIRTKTSAANSRGVRNLCEYFRITLAVQARAERQLSRADKLRLIKIVGGICKQDPRYRDVIFVMLQSMQAMLFEAEQLQGGESMH